MPSPHPHCDSKISDATTVASHRPTGNRKREAEVGWRGQLENRMYM